MTTRTYVQDRLSTPISINLVLYILFCRRLGLNHCDECIHLLADLSDVLVHIRDRQTRFFGKEATQLVTEILESVDITCYLYFVRPSFYCMRCRRKIESDIKQKMTKNPQFYQSSRAYGRDFSMSSAIQSATPVRYLLLKVSEFVHFVHNLHGEIINVSPFLVKFIKLTYCFD